MLQRLHQADIGFRATGCYAVAAVPIINVADALTKFTHLAELFNDPLWQKTFWVRKTYPPRPTDTQLSNGKDSYPMS